MGQPKEMIKQRRVMNQWSSWKVPEAFIWDAVNQPTNQPTKKLTKGGVLRRALGIVPC